MVAAGGGRQVLDGTRLVTKTRGIILSAIAGSAGALARIERAARKIIRTPFFSALARAARAFADEGVRAPSVEPPFLTLD